VRFPHATATKAEPSDAITVFRMDRDELQRIRDLIDELRQMREGSAGDLYRYYSGAISNLRHILRMHGKDYEPG
jgi:hypothetical protein